MSALAQVLLAQGERVSGSDVQRNPLLERIREMGGTIRMGHASSHVEGADLVVYSSSIPPHNPELIHARNQGIPVLHRGQMQARLVNHRRTIAVTGSHGKSTTTALAAELLVAAGWDPTVLLGAEVEILGGNARAGKGPYAVVEADESDDSLLWLTPSVAVITAIDEEHLDYFRNAGEILETYAAFADRVVQKGRVIFCVDDSLALRLLPALRGRCLTYGLSEGAQIRAQGIELNAGSSRYRCVKNAKALGSVRLHIPGIHNVVNSLAVVGLADFLGIDFRVTQKALANYRGAKRRFQIQGEVEGVLVVEDYAHHPAEIQATLKAARNFPGRRVRCVFQPHRFSRTRYLMSRWAESFALADEVILLPIYAASEEPVDGVSSETLLQAIRSSGNLSVSLSSSEEVLEQLGRSASSGDMVLFLGAGSVGSLARRLVESLGGRHVAVTHA